MKRLATKNNLKLIGTIILIALITEIVVFAIWYSVQPTQKMVLVNKTNTYQVSTGGFIEAKEDSEPSLDATFSAVSLLSLLNRKDKINDEKNLDFILSKYNESAGLFSVNQQISIEATYSAIGVLTVLNQTLSINRTQVIKAIDNLQTTNAMYRDVDETDTLHENTGELDHLFQAISIYDKLYTNQTEFYLKINRSKIAIAINSLQNDDGGVKEATVHPISNMRNAYYVTGIFAKLNTSLAFFENYGFSSLKLKLWIERQYTEEGFRFHDLSEPTPEATAYAIISLVRLGVNLNDIKSNFHEAIEEMLEQIIGEFNLPDEESFNLDLLHDAVLALAKINQLSELERKYLPEKAMLIAGWIFGIIMLLLISVILVNIYLTMIDDDERFFDVALRNAISKVINNYDQGIIELSQLLDYQLEDIVLIPHVDGKYGTLRVNTENYEFLISFEYDTWEPRELIALLRGTTHQIYSLTFYESLLIEKVKELLRFEK